MKKIVFTGGGSAGHVTPNIAILGKLIGEGWKAEYIGSEQGIERTIIEQYGKIPYHAVSTGKLRRYFDLSNFKDPFRVLKGVLQSYRLLKKLKPHVVFSKGGFVSVPVIIGSRLNRIPVIIHESDMTPGLANKIAIPFATKVCASFPETLDHLPKRKAVHTGSPIREELLTGNPDAGRKLTGFHSGRPTILVMGGSLGSQVINRALRDILDVLLKEFQIVHICGKGNVDDRLQGVSGYRQYEYVSDELADLLAMADMTVSRAGANAIFEFLAARKPMLLIPLTKQASRGDQLLNARSFANKGFCHILYEENLNAQNLLTEIRKLNEQRAKIKERMSNHAAGDSVSRIVQLIDQVALK